MAIRLLGLTPALLAEWSSVFQPFGFRQGRLFQGPSLLSSTARFPKGGITIRRPNQWRGGGFRLAL